MQEFIRRLRAALSGAERVEVLTIVARRVGVKAESLIPPYPEPSGKPLPYAYTLNGQPSKFKSDKQRRYVMALARSGRVPYKRTRQLGNSLTSVVREVTPDRARVQVGTNDRKARWVIGPDGWQSRYHAGHWWQLDKALGAGIEEIGQEANRTLAKQLAARLKGGK